MVKSASRKPVQIMVSMKLLKNSYCLPLFWNWPAHCISDHLLGAARPADVLARLLDGNRQVVPASVPIARRARGTTPNPIAPDLPLHVNVVEDPKFAGWRREVTLGCLGPLGVLDKLVRQSLAGDETPELRRRDPLNPAQIRQLIGERVVGAVEPEAPATAFPRAAMHSQRG